jgi:EAL domain-containing protein (putative c-di-GMP-specific phosphodiesterase class I)
MRDTSSANDGLNALCAQGIRFSIDDFGTGYSSLSYLTRLPVDSLKIDRSFVAGLGLAPANDAIVESIVALAHAMKLTAVAEGVETAAQLDTLRAMGCDFAQGFLLGRPAAASTVTEHALDLPETRLVA